MTTSPAVVKVLVVLNRWEKEVQNEYGVLRHDEWGCERDEVDIAAEALALAVRKVYGRRATWHGVYSSGTSLSPSEGPVVYIYGTVRGLTVQPGQDGVSDSLDRVWTEVWFLTP